MRRTTARRVVQAFAIERLLSFLDKFIDIAMILALILWGPVACFLVGVILSLIFCLSVLEVELRFRATGVEHLKEWACLPDPAEARAGFWGATVGWTNRRIKAVFRAMLRSYWLMLLIGSVAYLESDYVTLLLKREGESRGSIFLRVLLPSVAWSIGVWTLIFWGALELALSIWLWLTGCTPTECLLKEEWQPVLSILKTIERVLS